MSQRPKIYYTEAQIGLMWDRWHSGESLHQIARSFDRSIDTILRYDGFCRKPVFDCEPIAIAQGS
jgi:hypothetical protein